MARSPEQVKNYSKFLELQAELESCNTGQIALLHDGELIAVYDTMEGAYRVAIEKFELGQFSLQLIGEKPKNFGCFTHLVRSAASGAG